MRGWKRKEETTTKNQKQTKILLRHHNVFLRKGLTSENLLNDFRELFLNTSADVAHVPVNLLSNYLTCTVFVIANIRLSNSHLFRAIEYPTW